MRSADLASVRRTLWAAADGFRANSQLTPVQYRPPVLGLIFLAYAEHRFDEVGPELEARATARNPVTPGDYKAMSVLYVPDEARLSRLVSLPEGEDLGKATDEAIKAIETANPELKDVLPRGYQRLDVMPSRVADGGAADRWLSAEGGVAAVMVVGVQPAGQGRCSVG